MDIRKTVVSGSFYPDTKEEIKRYIEHFNSNFTLENELDMDIKALIVPHAGYIYSGFTSNLAYNIAARQNFENIIVIGPSHRHYLKGASIASYSEYETPLGNIKINIELVNKLKTDFDFLCFDEDAHFEHSTETQAPFIKNYFPNSKIIEIVYGELNFKELSFLIDKLINEGKNLIVISTDLSHFYPLKEANVLDNNCIRAITTNSIENLNKGCEACGGIGIKAIINTSIKNHLTNKFLHYCTSYDISKDDKKVVGYTSFLIGKKLN
ncbi:AmmeMemoRadiSam system protein B [Halarcobacter mediterraneus]|uniref:MEMO1 family protein CP965_13250 n=1 Tax=Halarcobacter mediterraneus TaxID=2023153 RepID=A0A4Q1ATE7_9BACT|nr:AmmeMemoRadiSam system protein B [Halarcobacter mediterraneus]RXK11728.1 AmmeMemoRadiSam system protein B [Halarcobacter mediterraneus]